jgi:hypothetical protein
MILLYRSRGSLPDFGDGMSVRGRVVPPRLLSFLGRRIWIVALPASLALPAPFFTQTLTR